MAKYKIFSGPYDKIFGYVGDGTYTNTFIQVASKGDNQSVIEKDIPRSPFVDANGKTQASLRETWEDPKVSLTYTQGNMNASVFSELIFQLFIFESSEFEENNEIGNLQNKINVCFAYYEGDIPCGFSITASRLDPSMWTASIIKNTTAAPKDRAVTLFLREDMHSHGLAQELSIDDVLKEINSKSIRKLLENILNKNGTANIDELDNLKLRIFYKNNIDDRDTEYPLFVDKIKANFKDIPESGPVKDYFNEIIRRSVSDINFYKDSDYERNSATLFDELSGFVNFTKRLDEFETSSSKDERDIYKRGQELIAEMQKVSVSEPDSESTLKTALQYSSIALENPQNLENIKNIAKLSEEVSGKESPFWKKLGVSLLIFASIVLVVAGILAAIPTGGASLLLSVLGAAGVGVGVGAATLAVGTGLGLFAHAREKGFAKSFTGFKLAIQKNKGASSTTLEEKITPPISPAPSDSGNSTGSEDRIEPPIVHP